MLPFSSAAELHSVYRCCKQMRREGSRHRIVRRENVCAVRMRRPA
jgi:hypothetical protein